MSTIYTAKGSAEIMNPFRPHAEGEARRASIVALIRVVLTVNDPAILQKHKNDLLDTLLWKYTEADGKHNTRYRSRAAQQCPQKDVRKLLQHEHVFPREKMIKELLKAGLSGAGTVLQNAIGCLVTREEHSHLTAIGDEHQGWERYKQAGVELHGNETT